MAKSGEILVIGAGIIGASIAYHVAKAGAGVVVLDRTGPAAGATGKSFAWINANQVADEAYHRFRRDSLSDYHRLNRELTSTLGVQWDGALCFDEAGDRLDQRLERFRAFDYPVEAVASHQFQGLEPSYREPPERALHSALEGAIEPVQATVALMDAAARLGARTIYGADVKALKRRAGKVIGVETDSGLVDAAVVVLAAGVGASPLLAGVGVDLPMNNRPGVMLHSKPVERMVNHVIWGDRIHVKQQMDGRLVIGEIFSEGETEIDGAAITEAMLAEVRRHLPGVDVDIERTTIGLRPIPEDGMPVVGHTRETGGLYVAVMHSGITLAPIIGRMSAGEILDDVRFEALEPYRPGRFAKPA